MSGGIRLARRFDPLRSAPFPRGTHHGCGPACEQHVSTCRCWRTVGSAGVALPGRPSPDPCWELGCRATTGHAPEPKTATGPTRCASCPGPTWRSSRPGHAGGTDATGYAGAWEATGHAGGSAAPHATGWRSPCARRPGARPTGPRSACSAGPRSGSTGSARGGGAGPRKADDPPTH